MPTLFITGFYFPDDTSKDKAANLLGQCLPIFERYGLTPMPFAKEAWNSSTPQIFGGTSLLHKTNASHTGDPFWGAGFMFLPAPGAKTVLVSMTIPASFPNGQEEGWNWLISLSEALCDEMSVELGVLNGMTIKSGDRATGGTPAGTEMAPGHPPLVLCPWMYWGTRRLENENLREGLTTLNTIAERSSPSQNGGWVLVCQKGYSGEKPLALMDTYSKQWNLKKVYWAGVK